MSLFDEMTKKKKQYDKEQKALADSIVKGTYKQRDTKQVKQTSSPLLKGSDAKWYNENFNKREYQKYDLDTTLDNAPISKEAKDRIYSSYGIENDSSKSVAKKLSNIKNGDYTYYEGGKTGTKDGAISIKEANALRKYINEQNAKKQQEEINNRTVDDWKQLRDLSDLELKEQQRNTNKLLKDRGLNARVVGTKIQSDVAPSRNDVKVGDKFENNLQKDANNNIAVMDFIQTDEGRNQLKNLRQKWDERAYNISGYETKKAQEDERNQSVLSKIAMSPIRGGASVFSWLRGDLATENGQLSSYNDAFLQAQSENAKTGIGRLGYNALSEIGKQTVVQALNYILPGSGTASYFTDIANDQYNNAINMGYSDKAALNYALLSTGTEAIFERFLGAGSNYFGGKMGAENVISGTLSKFIKNKTANDLLSSFISEGSEEFLEEYLGEFNKQLTLDWADKGQDIDYSKIFNAETTKNAFESFLIGGITGTVGATNQRIATPKDLANYNQAVYSIERKNGKLSQVNKQILNNMVAISEELGTPLNAKQIVDNFNNVKNAQISNFQNSALDLFPNLDEQSRNEYNKLINDASELIYDTGMNITFDPNLDVVSEIEGNNITINPTMTDMPIKTLLLKELGTQLVDNKTKQYILSSMKKNGSYDILKQQLLDSGEFDEANVDNELISIELNRIFDNQEELNKLVQNNKGAIENIKSLVDNLVSKITNDRTTKDAQYLRELGAKLNISNDLLNNNLTGEELSNREIENIERMESEEQTQNKIEEVPKDNKTTSNEVKQQDVIKETTDENKKVRKTYDSIIKSDNQTEQAKKISKKLMGLDTYIPDSNKNQVERADEHINKYGVEESLNGLKQNVEDKGKLDVNDIAIGERLIEYYSKTGDEKKLSEAIQLTAMAGTIAGRSVQAMSMINRQTPTGQVTWIQRSIDRMNKQMKEAYDKSKMPGKKLQQFDFTPEMQQKILNSTESNLEDNLNEVYKELGEQVQMSKMEALDSWRYFAMLSSPTTHIRNIVGNVLMGKMQQVKDYIKGGIEDIYYGVTGKSGERTGTLRKASKKYLDYAKNDIDNVKGQLGIGENKYTNPKTQLQKNMRMFSDTKVGRQLEKIVKKGLIDTTSNLLEVEDVWGLKSAYIKSMSQYLYANKIDLNKITDKQLAQARQFAVDQAKQATFHQDSALASALNTLENKSLAAKLVIGGVVPFKKTPFNVAKTSLEYNPVGLMKALTYDSYRLYNGNITANQYIDNLAKGLTGTGIALLGFALANAGIIRTTGDDDESFDEDRGIQPYSIILGDKTISLDWLSPTAVPLFVGAELFHQFNIKNNDMTEEEKNKGLVDLLNASVSSLNPVSEMTMLSGIQSALKTYSGDYAKALEEIGTNTIKTYASQFTPSILGKIAKTTDQYERTTTTTKKTTVDKAVDSFINQVKSKVPGLRQTLPVKTDVWGNEIKQESNVLLRGVYNLTSPATVKSIRENDLDKEIERLYNSTGEKSVLPKTYIDKYFTYGNKEYRLTNQEYAKYKQTIGLNNYNTLSNLIKSDEYKKLSDEQKKNLIEQVYSYNKSLSKDAYSKINNISYEPSNTYNNQKKSIMLGGNIEDYLLYNLQDFKADYDSNGKAISGTKKAKVIDYLNNSNMEYNQKLYLLAKDYAVSPEEKTYLANLINNSSLNKEEKLNLYKSLTGFKVSSDGTVRW